MEGSLDEVAEGPPGADEVRRFLADHPEFLRGDDGLLAELGLKVDGGNVVDFGPAALARVHAAHQREAAQRQQLEELARANFAAQAQTHGAVIDLLDARDLPDLARQVDEIARWRFGLACAVVAIEADDPPPGWNRLVEGQVDMLMGDERKLSRMGFVPTAAPLFGDDADQVQSIAMVRIALWRPAMHGVLAFGSAEPEGFTADMGPELIAFLARVVERTAERWPRP